RRATTARLLCTTSPCLCSAACLRWAGVLRSSVPQTLPLSHGIARSRVCFRRLNLVSPHLLILLSSGTLILVARKFRGKTHYSGGSLAMPSFPFFMAVSHKNVTKSSHKGCGNAC